MCVHTITLFMDSEKRLEKNNYFNNGFANPCSMIYSLVRNGSRSTWEIFSSIRATWGSNNNPTSNQFKPAFQILSCKTLNRSDNGNSYFDETISLVDLSSVENRIHFDLDLEWIIGNSENKFTENFLIYLSGFIMRTLLNNETCMYCMTYLKECKDRVTCSLIENKQRGGLIKPFNCWYIVAMAQVANAAFDRASEKYNTLAML